MIFKRFQHMKWSQTEENKSKINITFNIPVVCSLAWVYFNSSTVHLHLISKCFFWSLDSSWIALNHIHQQPPPHRACLSVLWKRFGKGVCTLSSMIFFLCVWTDTCNAMRSNTIQLKSDILQNTFWRQIERKPRSSTVPTKWLKKYNTDTIWTAVIQNNLVLIQLKNPFV